MIDGLIAGGASGVALRLWNNYQEDKQYKRERRAAREAHNQGQYDQIARAGLEYGAKSTMFHHFKRFLAGSLVVNQYALLWYLISNMHIMPQIMKTYGGKFFLFGNPEPNILAAMLFVQISGFVTVVTYYLAGRPKERVL